jgi:hypothetical protein
MRIAQVAPPFESVPPARYGGTARVISTLTEELVRRGHEVTLFASGDSRTSARLVSTVGRAFGTRRHGSRTLLRTGRSRSVISGSTSKSSTWCTATSTISPTLWLAQPSGRF